MLDNVYHVRLIICDGKFYALRKNFNISHAYSVQQAFLLCIDWLIKLQIMENFSRICLSLGIMVLINLIQFLILLSITTFV